MGQILMKLLRILLHPQRSANFPKKIIDIPAFCRENKKIIERESL